MVNDKFTTSEGTSITDKNEIVEQFNKYFTNIGSSLNSKLPKTGEDPIQHIKHNTASFLCAPTDPTEIINTSKEPVCPRVELILKIIIILLIIFLGFIKSKPC